MIRVYYASKGLKPTTRVVVAKLAVVRNLPQTHHSTIPRHLHEQHIIHRKGRDRYAMHDIIWREEDWIRRGRIYADFESKPAVRQKRDEILRIPEHFADKQLHHDLPVNIVLERIRFVSHGRDSPERRQTPRFSSKAPNTSLEQVFKACTLPPLDVLADMGKQFGQLWFDGEANSVIDWTYPEKRYPLACLTVFRDFSWAVELRSAWILAEDWMTKPKPSVGQLGAADLAKQLFYGIEWNANIQAINTTISTRSLVLMLREEWLSDSHVDMLMQVLEDRAARCGRPCNAIFASSVFQFYLERAYETEGTCQQSMRILERYKEQLTSGNKTCLYLIAHVNGNHWVAWKLDHQNASFGHGK